MSDTVITMEPVGDGMGSRRTLNAQHRNAASEKFELEFIGGRLMEVEPDAVEECDALLAWIHGLEGKRFTRDEAVAAMKVGQTGLKKTAIYDRIKALVSSKRLRKGWNTRAAEHEATSAGGASLVRDIQPPLTIEDARLVSCPWVIPSQQLHLR